MSEAKNSRKSLKRWYKATAFNHQDGGRAVGTRYGVNEIGLGGLSGHIGRFDPKMRPSWHETGGWRPEDPTFERVPSCWRTTESLWSLPIPFYSLCTSQQRSQCRSRESGVSVGLWICVLVKKWRGGQTYCHKRSSGKKNNCVTVMILGVYDVNRVQINVICSTSLWI